MTKEELRERLVDVIVTQLGVDSEEVIDSANFVNDFQTDSLDYVELFIAIEDYFGIQIPDVDIDKLDTVGKVIEYLCDKLNIK